MVEAFDQWGEFLNPGVLKRRILTAGIFLAAYEMLKASIIERPKEFFAQDWSAAKGWQCSDYYREVVLSKDPKGKADALRSSIAWLLEVGALSEEDVSDFRTLTDARNQFAHELSAVATGTNSPDFEALFPILRQMLASLERWWIVNVEMELEEDWNAEDLNVDEILPGRLITLDVMSNTAIGDEEAAWRFYNDFLEAVQAHRAERGT